MVPALAKAARRMPVILASRCPDGGVLSDTYGYAGGEIDLAARGLIRAGLLPSSKARAALILLLRTHQPAPAIRAFFTAYGGG
jgi:L-asparaginase